MKKGSLKQDEESSSDTSALLLSTSSNGDDDDDPILAPSPSTSDSTVVVVDNGAAASSSGLSCCQEVFTIALFCFMNFLNFVNRYSTPPVVGRLKASFHVDDTSLGLVQSGFEICYVLTSPIFGFLGDRWKRKYIMAFSLLLSTISGTYSSFISESSFLSLLITRSLLGIAEAGYTNICPSIIGDLFVGKKRTIVLTVYQFAIPLGMGFGYLLAGVVADIFDSWRWAFRLTPIPMFLSAVCLVCCIQEPERGAAEKAAGKHQTTSWRQDIKYLVRTPSFLLTSLGFVGVSYASAALCYWMPDLILRMLPSERSEGEIGLIFGLITIASGLTGVSLGVIISNTMAKPFFGLAGDGVVCGAGVILSAPVVYAGLVCLEVNMLACWILTAVGIALLSCNLVLVSEITLNVVIATRRATAESFQTTMSHFLGDAAAPYLCGLISDRMIWIHKELLEMKGPLPDYTSLHDSLFLTTYVIAISGGFFMYGSLYINQDAIKAKGMLSPQDGQSSSPSNSDVSDTTKRVASA